MPDIYTGPRGGKYYLRKGRKVYLKSLKKLTRSKGTKKSPKDWALEAPITPYQKEELIDRCGPKCFLELNVEDLGRSKYPICKKCRQGHCDCHYDCRGLSEAYKQAKRVDDQLIADRAQLYIKQIAKCPSQRGGNRRSGMPGTSNPWIKFLRQHKGQGYSRQELQMLYHQQRQS